MKDRLRDALNSFLTHRKLSNLSAELYRRDIERSVHFFHREGCNPCALELADCRKYLAHLRAQNIAASSISRQFSALRGFLRYLGAQGLLDRDPTELVSVRTPERKRTQHLTRAEVARLLAGSRGNTFEGVRTTALLELWYGTGLRVKEILALQMDDLDFKRGTLRVSPPSTRLIPVSRTALQACKRYIAIRTQKGAYLFVTRKGHPLSRQVLWKSVKNAAKDAELKKRVTPLTLRHTYAQHLLRGGAELAVVQKLLGHRTVATTDRYTECREPVIRDIQNQFHPRS